MFLIENPVLQRELLVNLRMTRAFVLLLVYVGLLGVVVYAAWPSKTHGSTSAVGNEEEASAAGRICSFSGQFVLLSLMVPSFAAGTITGEKERQTYEMLLASPMRPGADRAGQTAGRIVPPGGAGLLLAADRHALPAAGRRVAL